MNAIDPLQGKFPEVMDELLEHGVTKCIAFNRRGTLLAAGCSDGSCVIWDFGTRGIAKELKDKDCVSAINSVCWSKYGHQILVSAADRSLTLWDVLKGEKINHITLPQTPLQARLHPGSSTPSICLACPLSSAPMIVDLTTGTTTLLPVETDTCSRGKVSDGAQPFTPAAACFNKYGDLVYVGNSKGEVLVIDYERVQIKAMVPNSGGAIVENIAASRNGCYLLTHSNVIRIYENVLPSCKNVLKLIDEITKEFDELDGVEKLKAVGMKCLILSRKFQDTITSLHLKAPCCSGDGDWVIGGSASKSEHKIYIWDRMGNLVRILEGPKHALIDLGWHPIHPIFVSVSLIGSIYIWTKEEKWSAYAPDFKEREKNEEYVEREDEFDLNPDNEQGNELDANQDEEVDILNVEDSNFSDASQDELCYLPAIPCPDIVGQQDQCAEISSKLVDNDNSRSPHSKEAGVNGHTTNHASSPLGVLDNPTMRGGTETKRRRKLSEKPLELQAEKNNSADIR